MHRVKELDSLRGLAALTIVLFHLWFQRYGILGSSVDLFFVLSGYLITKIILSNTLTSHFLITFYIRRGLRIWPIYYLLLLVLVVVLPALPSAGTLDDLPYFLTFTQEIARFKTTSPPTFPSAFRHTWSLAIEEQFYLLWPPLVWWLGRKGLPLLSLSLVTLSAAARCCDLSAFILITHCDGLALGGLLAGLLSGATPAVETRRGAVRLLWVLGLGAAALLAATIVFPACLDQAWPAAAPDVFERTFKPFFLNLIFFALVGLTVLHANGPRLRYLRDPRLVYLGSISYGLYLYHHFIFEICKYYENAFMLSPGLFGDLVKLLASILLAMLSWKFIERPILSLKDRFRYQRAAAPRFPGRPQVDDLRGAQAS
jgi:peptidoglycan/LPS O-acetylase OafA/YrhL